LLSYDFLVILADETTQKNLTIFESLDAKFRYGHNDELHSQHYYYYFMVFEFL